MVHGGASRLTRDPAVVLDAEIAQSANYATDTVVDLLDHCRVVGLHIGEAA